MAGSFTKPKVLGPFKGGLNNFGEASTIDDAQLAAVNNFDIDNDGSLVSRPPINFEITPPGRVSTTIATNLATNPRLGVNATNWNLHSGSGTGATATRGAAPGVPSFITSGQALRITFGPGAVATGGGFYLHTGITAGLVYSFGIYARIYQKNIPIRMRLMWQDASGNALAGTVYGPGSTQASSTFQGFIIEGVTAPAGAAQVLVSIVGSDPAITWTNGTFLDMTGALIVQSPNLPTLGYFDGSSTNSGTNVFAWTGTADASSSTFSDTSAIFHFVLLGYYVRSDGETFLVGTSGPGGTTNNGTWTYQLSTKAFVRIWTGVASDFVQYDNKIVLCSETQAGGYWDGTAATFTATSTMPAASMIVLYNGRFWAFGPKGSANATTVYFSNLTVISPASSIYNWTTASDFFTVDKGDGQWITCIISDPNALLIFRNGSTYQFTYPSSPSAGTLRKLNSQIGADNVNSVVAYENYYMILNAGILYQFINYLYYPRNTKLVDFERSSMNTIQTVALSIFGTRAIVYYYGMLYVYNLVSGTWTTWSTNWNSQRFLQIPASSVSGDTRTALIEGGGIEQVSAQQGIRRITDEVGLQVGVGESFVCYAKTKTYNFDDAGIFKRLMYWAISYRSASGVKAIANPVDIVSGSTTWNQMAQSTWNTIAQNTWNSPLLILPTVIDDIPFPSSVAVQGLAKVRSAIRFKSIFFEVQLKTTGTQSTAPARIFSITAYLKNKARAADKVS